MERLTHPKPKLVKRPSVEFKGRKSTARGDKPQKQRSINQIERGDPVSEGSKIPKDTDGVQDNLCFKKPCPSPQIFIVGDVKQRNEEIFIKGEIKNKEITMLVDTGSSVTIINPKLFEEIDPKRELNSIATNIRLKSANSNHISVLGECPLNLKLRNKLFPHTFVIAQIKNSCIIGVDFMS